ncbi:MAG: LacI family transcriptional regulator [Sphingomonadales bacterium 32-67-7]|nr:MAG: LacI family transcriptional regulator [Sphingomonadales bacterium 32-67-7]
MARRKQAVTIKHVAADAGVSLQTVSRVINKEPNVRPEMMARVQESIARLGYVPSIAAQRMSGSRSYLIMALNDRERTIEGWKSREGTDWVDQMLFGGMLTCAEHGYRLIVELVDTHSDHIERELSAAIAALQPDGVLLTPPHSANPKIMALLDAAGIEQARIGSLMPGPGFRLTMGDDLAAAMATRHLIELGHTRIGFIAGSLEYELSGWRVDGWRAAMDEAGLSTEGMLAQGDFSIESGRVCAPQLIDAGATAVIASNDQMAMATLEVVRARGLAVPGDLSIVSFDDTPVVRFAHPPLTAIEQPIAAVTARAVELIIGARSCRAALDTPVVVAPSLTVRESTAPPRS